MWAILSAILPLVVPVSAPKCFATDSIHAMLSLDYGQRLVFTGRLNTNAFELWGGYLGDFTLIENLPSGVSCIVAEGEDGRLIAAKPNI